MTGQRFVVASPDGRMLGHVEPSGTGLWRATRGRQRLGDFPSASGAAQAIREAKGEPPRERRAWR